jgi:hypothetical protein
MSKNKNLKIVIDFIADYLTDSKEEVKSKKVKSKKVKSKKVKSKKVKSKKVKSKKVKSKEVDPVLTVKEVKVSEDMSDIIKGDVTKLMNKAKVINPTFSSIFPNRSEMKESLNERVIDNADKIKDIMKIVDDKKPGTISSDFTKLIMDAKDKELKSQILRNQKKTDINKTPEEKRVEEKLRTERIQREINDFNSKEVRKEVIKRNYLTKENVNYDTRQTLLDIVNENECEHQKERKEKRKNKVITDFNSNFDDLLKNSLISEEVKEKLVNTLKETNIKK